MSILLATMIIFMYFKTAVLLFLTILSGVTIIKRVVSTEKPQIVIPAGIIFGLSFYLFLINLLAYIIKGAPLFYIGLIVELLIAYFIQHKIPISEFHFPQGKALWLWIFSLVFWGGLLFIITNTSPFDGAHDIFYQSHASTFARGDFPIHTPWQPDYIGYHHFGASQIMGAMRSITGADYFFLQFIVSFFMLFAVSQILAWIALPSNTSFHKLIIFFLPPVAALITIGFFIFAWPTSLTLPAFDGNLFKWLSELPGLEFPHFNNQFNVFSTSDSIILFFHRLLATSFFICLTFLLLFSTKKSLMSVSMMVILLAAIALTDESILMMALPATFFIGLFAFFKNKRYLLILLIMSTLVISLQGGIVTESLLNRYKSGPGFLILPEDRESPFEKFRSWRLLSQSSYLYKDIDEYQPLTLFHPGIIWQILALFILGVLTLFWYRERQFKVTQELIYLVWLFIISSTTVWIAFHVIVPFPFHINGLRLLTLAYQFSGIGIAFFLSNWLANSSSKRVFVPKIIIFWILFFSILPPLFKLFPRPDKNWVQIKIETPKITFEWIKKNLSVKDRILVLTDTGPVPSSNMDLVKQIGAHTPIWSPEIRSHDMFDTSPTYADLFYTLNPSPLKILKVDYLILADNYIQLLPESRKLDIQNEEYFRTVFQTLNNERVVKVMPKYLNEAKVLDGTLEELNDIAPKEGVYYIDHWSTTHNKNLYRSILITLRDRKFYGIPDYWNGRVDVYIPFYGLQANHYDYLVLGNTAEPKTFCNCQAKLIWSGLNNGIRLWKTGN